VVWDAAGVEAEKNGGTDRVVGPRHGPGLVTHVGSAAVYMLVQLWPGAVRRLGHRPHDAGGISLPSPGSAAWGVLRAAHGPS
jgi:hypothetical protein